MKRAATVDYAEQVRSHVVAHIAQYGRYVTYVEGKGLGVAVAATYATVDEYLAAHPTPATPSKAGKATQVEGDPEAKHRQAEALAFVRGYTGTFGLILDIAADPRMGTKYMRLSDRQVEVILASRDRDLARATATQIAQELYADDQYRASLAPRPEAAPVASQRPATAPVGSPAAEGFYRRDGSIFKVQKAVHGSGHLYAKRLIVENGAARWEYAPGVIRTLTERLTLAEAEAFGKLYGICAVCGRILTDEKSIARGIGPVCAGKLS